MTADRGADRPPLPPGGAEAAGAEVSGLVAHLFRHEAGRITAVLCRDLGAGRLDLAEEAVQEAMFRALRTWPFRGIPDSPAGWLFRVARHTALDRIRRISTRRRKEPDLVRLAEATPDPAPDVGDPLDDELLRLVFLCAHPVLSPDSRVALTLKVALGFSTEEIARAFVARSASVGQRISRAKAALRDAGARFVLPPPEELPDRLASVLEVVYLLFGEGHTAGAGDRLVRRDLCDEALRLVELLLRSPATDLPETRALGALLWLLAARLPARADAHGDLVLLEDQDRSAWDRSALARGFRLLEASAAGDVETGWHLQAAIAAEHAVAPTARATDWAAILALYDRLVARDPSPVARLHRAVALSRARGPEPALLELERLVREGRLDRLHRLPAVRGDLLAGMGRVEEARRELERAVDLVASEPERRHLVRRLEELSGRAS